MGIIQQQRASQSIKKGLPFIGAETAFLIDDELRAARMKHRDNFHNLHEGYAVLKEEVDELWEAIKKNRPTEEVRAEAVQVAAMAIRIINELT